MTRNATAMTMSIIKSKKCRVNVTVFSGKEFRDREKRERKIKNETDIHSLGLCMIFPDFSI